VFSGISFFPFLVTLQSLPSFLAYHSLALGHPPLQHFTSWIIHFISLHLCFQYYDYVSWGGSWFYFLFSNHLALSRHHIIFFFKSKYLPHSGHQLFLQSWICSAKTVTPSTPNSNFTLSSCACKRYVNTQVSQVCKIVLNVAKNECI